ncbi:hypothetical protein VSK91_19700 [Bacillus swezeyi]|uniref:hypothetical protein n=1 Tax=Bacillus swezeyi TaxID=1925020 RepID=UPI00123C0791|nr:hypothetical protein [Bacillus swezeyi]KAA6472209.1 hypothetical protein DX928_22560 [Bacillus swezeyi]MED2945406.1 hypothetical protein [Bacillus swezeyi]MED2979646.1 hypothetical protein [Bacillus swezeyi]
METLLDELKIEDDYIYDAIETFREEKLHIRNQIIHSDSSLDLFNAKVRIDEFFNQVNKSIKLIKITCSDLFEKKEMNKAALDLLIKIRDEAKNEFSIFISHNKHTN